MIVSEGRTLKVPVIFTRENRDSHNQTVNMFIEKEITFKCWDEDGFEKNYLRLLRGHSGQMVRVGKGKLAPETMLRIFMITVGEEGDCCEEIGGFLSMKYQGLTIKVSKSETVLTTEMALEKIRSGTVMFLDEQLQKRRFEV